MMHKEYSDKEIFALYRDYQDSRTDRHSEGRGAVLEVLKAHRNEADQKTKKTVIAQAIKAVREKDNAHTKTSNGSNNTSEGTLSIIHQAISRIHKFINNTPTWQYALPILAMAAVLFGILPQLNQKESTQVQVAVSPQESLIDFSEQLAPSIQTVTGTEFGFSNTQSIQTTAFNLGVTSVDLPILAHANNHYAVAEALAKIDTAEKPTKQSNVKKELLILKTSLEKSTDNKNKIYLESVQLAESLKELAYGNEQQAFYEFGEWLEVSLLASIITNDNKNGHLLKQQLKKRTGIFNKLQKNTPPNTQPLNRLLSELDLIAANDILQASEVRKLQHKLNQIKAFLQE